MANRFQRLVAKAARMVLGDAVPDAAADSAQTQLEFQRLNTGFGVAFGQDVSNDALWKAATREPVAHFLTFIVGNDIFDKMFTVKPLRKISPERFNQRAMDVLAELNAKAMLSKACVRERIFGECLLVIGYEDKAEDLKLEVKNPTRISHLEVYDPRKFEVVDIDEDPDSERFGDPVIYKLDRGHNVTTEIHFSRVIPLNTRDGLSVLESVYDDMTIFRNMRWGIGQTLYRYGPGFPVITLKGLSSNPVKALEQLRELQSKWGPLTSKTSLWKTEQQEIEFKGLEGRALDPKPYVEPIQEQFATGSGLSNVTIRGAQAGKLTGSEVNERKYFKYISDCQSLIEPYVRRLLDALIETGQITPKSAYEIEWPTGFEINEVDQARAKFWRSQTIKNLSLVMQVNEIREKELDLEPVDGGDVILGLRQQGDVSDVSEKNAQRYTKRMLKVQETFAKEHSRDVLAGKPVDQLLAGMIKRSDSVAQICRTLGIANDTFYNWAQEFGLWP